MGFSDTTNTEACRVKLNINDPETGYLLEKLAEGDNITFQVVDTPKGKQLVIHSVLTADQVAAKLAAADDIEITYSEGSIVISSKGRVKTQATSGFKYLDDAIEVEGGLSKNIDSTSQNVVLKAPTISETLEHLSAGAGISVTSPGDDKVISVNLTEGDGIELTDETTPEGTAKRITNTAAYQVKVNAGDEVGGTLSEKLNFGAGLEGTPSSDNSVLNVNLTGKVADKAQILEIKTPTQDGGSYAIDGNFTSVAVAHGEITDNGDNAVGFVFTISPDRIAVPARIRLYLGAQDGTQTGATHLGIKIKTRCQEFPKGSVTSMTGIDMSDPDNFREIAGSYLLEWEQDNYQSEWNLFTLEIELPTFEFSADNWIYGECRIGKYVGAEPSRANENAAVCVFGAEIIHSILE